MKKLFVAFVLVASVSALLTVVTETNAKTFKWQMQTYTVPGEKGFGVTKEMADRIDKRSDGRLQITVHPPGVLGYESWTVHQPVSQGLLEIGESSYAGIAGEIPVFKVFDHCIYRDLKEVNVAHQIARPVFNEAVEIRGLKLIRATVKPICNWFSTVPIKSASDWRGIKARAWTATLADWVKAMGGSPLTIPYGEIFTSLAMGVIQTDSKSVDTVIEMKFADIKGHGYYSLWPNLPWITATFINLKAYKELPSELQNILIEEFARSEEQISTHYATGAVQGLKDIQKLGVKVIQPEPEELAKGDKIYRQLAEKWLEKVKTTDPKAAALMQTIMAKLQQSR